MKHQMKHLPSMARPSGVLGKFRLTVKMPTITKRTEDPQPVIDLHLLKHRDAEVEGEEANNCKATAETLQDDEKPKPNGESCFAKYAKASYSPRKLVRTKKDSERTHQCSYNDARERGDDANKKEGRKKEKPGERAEA